MRAENRTLSCERFQVAPWPVKARTNWSRRASLLADRRLAPLGSFTATKLFLKAVVSEWDLNPQNNTVLCTGVRCVYHSAIARLSRQAVEDSGERNVSL